MERIGRYEITGELGRGAMGVVYRAQDPAIGRTVAIKTIRLGEITDPAEHQRLRERLMREARSAGLLSHPSIVTIYDVGEEGNMAYIAMEFVQGHTLEQLVRKHGPLAGQQLIQVLRETAEALDYAHARGIIHRDVKPANIMIADSGAVKITDFGVAKIASQNMTQADTILGTPSFMSPEQIEGKPIDGRSDQFALAVITYELLTGEKPFAGDTLPGLLYQIVKQEPTSPHLLNASLREPVSRVIAQAMDKNLEQRFLKCTAFVRALESALNDSTGWRPIPQGAAATQETMIASGSMSGAPAPSPLPPPRRRPSEESTEQVRRRWPAVLTVFGLLALAGAGYLYYLNRPYVATTQTETGVEPPPVAADPNADGKPSPMLPPQDAPPPPETGSVPETPVETPTPTSTPVETKAAAKAPPPRTTPPSEVPPGTTILDIITVPGGATVSVDSGRSSCVTPCPQSLENGRHTLAFTLPGYRPTVRIVNLPQETTVNVSLLRSEGTLMIRSNPPGAAILVDDKARNERTPTTLTLPAGHHKITLRRDGSPDYSETIEIKDQVITNINVNW